jgi:hypothetical protein
MAAVLIGPTTKTTTTTTTLTHYTNNEYVETGQNKKDFNSA